MKNRLMILTAFLLLSIFLNQDKAIGMDKNQLQFSIKSSPSAEFKTSLSVQNNHLYNEIANSKYISLSYPTPFMDTYLQSPHSGEELQIDKYGNIYRVNQKLKLNLKSETKKEIVKYITIIKNSHYGQLLPWEDVNKIIPRKAIAEVIDIETGLSFNVQRRAGNLHADVQPLSFQDTKILKKIYNGRWSWIRKAILVKIDDQLIAASMHGMPHGIGSLKNGFPGHFCIHFYQSKTHKTKELEPTHQVMVYKAAGRMTEYLDQASPFDVIDIYLMAMNQRDEQLLKMLYSSDARFKLPNLLIIEMISTKWIARQSEFVQINDSQGLYLKIPVVLSISKNGSQQKSAAVFHIKRNSFYEPWKIADIEF